MPNDAHSKFKLNVQRRFRAAIRACDVASVKQVLLDIDGDFDLIGGLKALFTSKSE